MVLLSSIALAVLVGALLQRLSGTGTGLLLSPVLTLLLGPESGVFLTNCMTVVTATILLLGVRRLVDWSRWRLLCGASLVGVVPGAFVATTASSAWLQILVGGAVLAGLGVTSWFRDARPVAVRPGALLAGVAGGFLNVTCGVAAAAMVVHARTTQWAHSTYAATMQPTFAFFGASSVLAKLAFGASPHLGGLTWWAAPVLVVASVAGGGLGSLAARRVSAERARTVAMVLAGTGAAVTVLRGVLAL